MTDTIRCPRCGRKYPPVERGETQFCTWCRVYFDGEDDGDYDTNPTRRIERQEEYVMRQRERRQNKWRSR
jgi:adenine-specific DNA methylase